MHISKKGLAVPGLLAFILAAGPAWSQRILNSAAKNPQSIPYNTDQVKPPQPIFRVDAECRCSASYAQSAAVTMRIIINEEGQVWSAEVIKGFPHLNQAALNAAIQWHYAPTILEGKAVPVISGIRMHFVQEKGALSFGQKGATGVSPPRRDPVRTTGNYLENRILLHVEPEFPPAARASRVSGVVLLSVVVNEKGEVYEAKVLRGHPLLNQAAEEAVRQWLFKPTVIHGESVPVLGTVAVIFNFR